MSTYTDLHTRVIKENIAILRKPSCSDDGTTFQRVIFANKDNVYYGTFKGPLEISGGALTDIELNGGKLNGTDITNAIVAYNNEEYSGEQIVINQLANIDDISALQIGHREVLSAFEDLSNDMHASMEALSTKLDSHIKEFNLSADSWNHKISAISSSLSDLSGTTTTISNTLADAIEAAKDDAISTSNAYTGKEISGLSSTIDNRLEELSCNLSSYSKELCAQVLSVVDSEYVHKDGDCIEWLSVSNGLSVRGGCIAVDDDTTVIVTDDLVSITAQAPVAVKSNSEVSISSNQNLTLVGDYLDGNFQHGIALSTENGLDSIKVNGTSLQNTLQSISGHLNDIKLDISTASMLSNQICSDVVNSGYLKATSVDFDYYPSNHLIALTVGSQTLSIDTTDFVKTGMLSGAEVYTQDGKKYIRIVWNTESISGSGTSETTFSVDDLVDIYKASGNGIVLSDDNTFYLDFGYIKTETGLQALSNCLYGTPEKNGKLVDFQNQISAISVDAFGSMHLAGHFLLDASQVYQSIPDLFTSVHQFDPPIVKNDTAYNVVVHDDGCVVVNLDSSSDLSISTGDVIVVHDHSMRRFVPINELTYNLGSSDNAGNVYVFKAGVSRYEFNSEIQARADGDENLSIFVEDTISSLSIDNSISVGQILTSLTQSNGKIAYETKTLEISDVSGLLDSLSVLTDNDSYLSNEITGLSATLSIVSSDYLTSSDKAEITNMISTASADAISIANDYTDEKFNLLSDSLSDYYMKSETSSAAEISSELNKYQLSGDYLDKRLGGSISGDVEVHQHDLRVLSGNMLQGNSLTSGTGYGDSNGDFVPVQMSGESCTALGQSQSLGKYSFAANEGRSYAKNSVAFGNSNAYGSYAFANGASTSALGYASHAEGHCTQTGLPEQVGNSSGRQTYGAFAHAEGFNAKAVGKGSHAEGEHTTANGNYSHAEGSYTETLSSGVNSHAEGGYTQTSAANSHAEGYYSKAIGYGSHAEGHETSAIGYFSHAEGHQTYAEAEHSHASGIRSKTRLDDKYAFVWQGALTSWANFYESHGIGTFNINPINAISGFYIGSRSLASYLDSISASVSFEYATKEKASDMSAYALDQAKEYANDMSIALSNSINALDVNNTIEVGQIISSLQQVDGKMSYGTKVLEISDVSGLQIAVNELTASDYYLSSQISTTSSLLSDYYIKSQTSSTNEISLALSLKQDALTDAQLSAVDYVADEQQTIIAFDDGTTSSFHWTVLDQHALYDAGIYDAYEEEWIKYPTNVKVGKAVRGIGSMAFYYCTSLSNIEIPYGVQYVDVLAFSGCTGLTHVEFPNSITANGDSMFDGCTNLTSVKLSDKAPIIKDSTFNGCGLLDIAIPDSINTINQNAFESCQHLSSVIIGNNVKEIAHGAFFNCSSISSIVFPSSVRHIGENAFDSCDSLTSILFKGKTLAQVEAMANYPWGIADTSIISTWNDASQEWVSAQGYALSSDCSAIISGLSAALSSVDDQMNLLNAKISQISSDIAISAFYENATVNGIENVPLKDMVSAMYNFLSIFCYNS